MSRSKAVRFTGKVWRFWFYFNWKKEQFWEKWYSRVETKTVNPISEWNQRIEPNWPSKIKNRTKVKKDRKSEKSQKFFYKIFHFSRLMPQSYGSSHTKRTTVFKSEPLIHVSISISNSNFIPQKRSTYKSRRLLPPNEYIVFKTEYFGCSIIGKVSILLFRFAFFFFLFDR